jgi:ABC-type histidine transport system ATPase subunit
MTAWGHLGNLIQLIFNSMDLKDLHKDFGFKEVQHASALEVEKGNPLSPFIFW